MSPNQPAGEVLKPLPFDEATSKIFCAALIMSGQDPSTINDVLKTVRGLREGSIRDPMLTNAIAALSRPLPQGERAVDAGHATKVIEHARKMSDVLLKVRPMGGSEMFTRIKTGEYEEYYADPAFCGEIIERMRSELREAKTRPASDTGWQPEQAEAHNRVEIFLTRLTARKDHSLYGTVAVHGEGICDGAYETLEAFKRLPAPPTQEDGR